MPFARELSLFRSGEEVLVLRSKQKRTKMRIACLQFAPRLGDVDNNLTRADAVLSKACPEELDLLVLPELAFTGMF